MASDLFRDLDSTVDRILRARPPWTQRLRAAGIDTVAEAIDAVRNHLADPTAADQAVRALADAARDEPDAMTVLVHALAPLLRARLSRSHTAEYRADVLVEVVFVIVDATERGDLERCDRLAARLVNRAHSRAHKQARRSRVRGVRYPVTTNPCPPEALAVLADHQVADRDPAVEAVARVDLAQFARRITDALAAGELSAGGWATYRDHRLRRALATPDQPTSVNDRTRARRFALRLQPYVEQLLGTHAA